MSLYKLAHTKSVCACVNAPRESPDTEQTQNKMQFSILCKIPIFGNQSNAKSIHKKGIRDPRLCRDDEFGSVEFTWLVSAIRTINKLSKIGSQTYVYAAACYGISVPFEAVCTETARYVTVNVAVEEGLPLRIARILGIVEGFVDPAATMSQSGKSIPLHPATRAHDNLLESVVASTFQKLDGADTRLTYKQVNDTSASQLAWVVDELTQQACRFSQNSLEMGIVRGGKPHFSKSILSSIFDKTIAFKKQLEQLSPSSGTTTASDTENDVIGDNLDTPSPIAHFPPLPHGPPPPHALTTTNKRPCVDILKNHDSERLRLACVVLQGIRFPLLTPLDMNTDWAMHASKYHDVWA